jgi:hypothetical protein
MHSNPSIQSSKLTGRNSPVTGPAALCVQMHLPRQVVFPRAKIHKLVEGNAKQLTPTKLDCSLCL